MSEYIYACVIIVLISLPSIIELAVINFYIIWTRTETKQRNGRAEKKFKKPVPAPAATN